MSLTHSGVALMLPVTDVDRATRFYQESLGLEFTGTNDEGSAMYALEGGSTLMLLPRPAGTRSDSTALSFDVDDVAAEVAELETRGVAFEDYDTPGLRTEHHVADLGSERAAWLLDPDGNVICLHESVG